MMIGGGTNVREKPYVVVVFAPSKNVPRHRHCLRAKLNLNETKKRKRGRCRGCSMAEPTTERGRSALAAAQWEGSMSERGVCDSTPSRVEAYVVGATCTVLLGGHAGLYPCVLHTLVHLLYAPGNLIWQFGINTMNQMGTPGWCFLLHIYLSYRAVVFTGAQVASDKALTHTLHVFWGGERFIWAY